MKSKAKKEKDLCKNESHLISKAIQAQVEPTEGIKYLIWTSSGQRNAAVYLFFFFHNLKEKKM